jgi:hypothetical protein
MTGERVQEGLYAIWNPFTNKFGSIYQEPDDAYRAAARTHLKLEIVKVRVEEMI